MGDLANEPSQQERVSVLDSQGTTRGVQQNTSSSSSKKSSLSGNSLTKNTSKPKNSQPKGGKKVGAEKEKKPEKDRKKLIVACIGCRKKKIKCSSDRPACTNCLRLNIPCEYPVIRNRGSRFGYMEMLNRRMQHLEKYINCSTNPEYRPQFVTIHQKPRRNLNQLAFSNSGSTRGTVNSGYTNIKSDLTQTPEAETLITQLGPRLTKELTPPSSLPAPALKGETGLPPQEIILHLAELYFRHVHGQTYSFLHKATFIPRIKQGTVNRTLLLAICGLTARYSRHPLVTSSTPHEAGEHFIAAARKSLSEEFDEPTIETIQAVIIIVQHDFFRSKGKKSMIYVSLAIRMATSLELHLEPADLNMSFQERETRRRTYWSLVVLDRLAHSGPHWQVHLRTDTLQLQLPCKDYYYENNIPVITETLEGKIPPPIRITGNPTIQKGEKGLHAYIVMATILWCDINKYVMEEFKNEKIPPWKEGSSYHSLETRLQQLFSSLPKEYQYSRENLLALDTLNQGAALIHLHAELVLSLCYLSRSMYPFNYTKMKFDEHPPKAFIERAAINIMTSANAQSSMIEDELSMEDFHMAPFVGFGVFALSSVHIANSFSPDPAVSLAAKNNLAINLKFLVIMREYWYSVGVWCIILKDRYFQKARRHKLKAQQVSYNNYPEGNTDDGSMGMKDSLTGGTNGNSSESTPHCTPGTFSRPGSPPLAYAPEELISVATNKTQSSEPSSGVSSPRGSGTRNKFDQPSPIYEQSSNRTAYPKAGNSSDINFRASKQNRLIPESSTTAHLQQQSNARTWERAVSKGFDNRADIDTQPSFFQSQKRDFSDNSFSNKRVKFEKDPESSEYSKLDTNSTYVQPTSPSQFADIFTMPNFSRSQRIRESLETPSSYSENNNEFSSSITPLDTFSVKSQESQNPNIDVAEVGGKLKNNLLQDTSGEWLNSLELTEFTRLANDDRSLIDLNNPIYWFDTEMKVQLEEQQRVQEHAAENALNPSNLVSNLSISSESNLIPGKNARFDKDKEVKRVTVSLQNENDPKDLRVVDESLFHQSLIHQPFTPEITLSDMKMDHSTETQVEPVSLQSTPRTLNQDTPKTQSLLEEIFQQVGLETLNSDASDSSGIHSPL